MKQFRQINLILSGKYVEQLPAELFGFFFFLYLCITSKIMQAKPVATRTSVFVFLCILLAADKQHRLSSLLPIGQPDLFLTSSFCYCRVSKTLWVLHGILGADADCFFVIFMGSSLNERSKSESEKIKDKWKWKMCFLPYRLIYRTQLSTTTGIGCPESCQMESNHQCRGRKTA